MSKVAIQGAATGTGVFTLASPATNTDRTLTLPDEAGTIDTLQRAGNVLQVVQAIATSSTIISTNTDTAITEMSASITPSSTSSRILVMITLGEFRTALANGARFQLYRNGSKIRDAVNEAGYSALTPAGDAIGMTLGWSFVDSPSTTSATTYAFYARKLVNANATTLDIMPNGASTSSVILMEVAA